MKKFIDHQPNQGSLMPVYLPDWLPADHDMHAIGSLVEQLELSAIERAYKGGGHPAYNPLMMVKILFYAFRLGVRSSRQIERMLYENIPMRVLSGNQQPDHWTINQFRRRYQEALSRLLCQTVVMAMKAGLVELKHVAADGTKIKANASKHSAMSYARMEEAEKRLSADIDAWFKESDAVDEAEDQEMGDRRGNELAPHLIMRRSALRLSERPRRSWRPKRRRGKRPTARSWRVRGESPGAASEVQSPGPEPREISQIPTRRSC